MNDYDDAPQAHRGLSHPFTSQRERLPSRDEKPKAETGGNRAVSPISRGLVRVVQPERRYRDELTQDQIRDIYRSSKTLSDFKFRLFGPVTDDRLSDDRLRTYLISKGVTLPEKEPKATQEKYDGPAVGPLYLPHDWRRRTIPVPTDDPLQRDYMEIVGTAEQADAVKTQIWSDYGRDKFYEALGAWALSGGKGGASRAFTANVPEPTGGRTRSSGAPTYESNVGAYKQAPEPYGGLVPPTPGEAASMKGFQNELEVARITDGRLARQPVSSAGVAPKPLKDAEIRFTRPNGQQGVARPDVYGKNGELIYVGGPSKGNNLPATIERLKNLRDAAASRNVKAQAYFTSDTPSSTITVADKVLGRDNVRTFDRPAYQQPSGELK